MEEALEEANQKLERTAEVEKSLTKDKGKLEVEEERLKTKVSEAKNISISESSRSLRLTSLPLLQL